MSRHFGLETTEPAYMSALAGLGWIVTIAALFVLICVA